MLALGRHLAPALLVGFALSLVQCKHDDAWSGSAGSETLDLGAEVLGQLEPHGVLAGLPDDPMLPEQGNIRDAWAIEVGAPAVVVAVIDTGFPHLTNEDVRDIIRDTADPIDGLNPARVGLLGTGRIDFMAALEAGDQARPSRPR